MTAEPVASPPARVSSVADSVLLITSVLRVGFVLLTGSTLATMLLGPVRALGPWMMFGMTACATLLLGALFVAPSAALDDRGGLWVARAACMAAAIASALADAELTNDVNEIFVLRLAVAVAFFLIACLALIPFVAAAGRACHAAVPWWFSRALVAGPAVPAAVGFLIVSHVAVPPIVQQLAVWAAFGLLTIAFPSAAGAGWKVFAIAIGLYYVGSSGFFSWRGDFSFRYAAATAVLALVGRLANDGN